MYKSLLALVVSGSVALAGCSSSDSIADNSPDRLPPIWSGPEMVDVPENPIEGADPDFGQPLPPGVDHPQEGVDVDWGVPAIPSQPPIVNGTPSQPIETVDPDFGIPTPQIPPTWSSPEDAYTFDGSTFTSADGQKYTVTSVNWRGHEFKVEDEQGNNFDVRMVREGEHAGSYYVFDGDNSFFIGGDTIKGGISPSIETSSPTIDRDSVRDAIRHRLNR